MKPIGLVIIFWLSLMLISCQPVIDLSQPVQTNKIILNSDQTLGQTFVTKFNGFAAVGLHLTPSDQAAGVFELEIKDSLKDVSLRRAELPTTRLAEQGSSYFYFKPINSSKQNDYYFSLKYHGSGNVLVSTAPGSVYLNGAAYQNNTPIDSQIAFELVYAPKLLAAGMVQEIFTWIGWTSLESMLFFIPGWGILCWLHPRWSTLVFWEKLGLSGGLSLCLFPIVLLWSNVIGAHLGRLNAGLLVLSGILSIIIHNWKFLRSPKLLHLGLFKPDWPGVTIFLGMALTVVIRYWVIRSLDLPLWGDSLQHTMMTQLIVDHGGLFQSWQPYTDLLSFSYHFGFHSLAASFSWISGLPVPQAVLITGQQINAIAVLTLYPLTMRLTGNRWSAVAAVILAGIVFGMPMYFLNWGRYTQLTGLAILAVAVTLLIEAFEAKRPAIPLLILVWIAWAGLALSHYRVLIFGLLFVAAYMLLKLRRDDLVRLGWNSLVCLVGAFLLTAPWFIRVFTGKTWNPFFSQLAIPANQISEYSRQSNSLGNINFYLPVWVWILLPVVIGIGLWKRRKVFALVSLWWFFILLAANPQWLNLPGTGLLTSFAVMISAYFPASILLGSGFGLLADYCLTKPWQIRWFLQDKVTFQQHVIPIMLSFILLTIAFFSISSRINDLSLNHALAARPDVRAAAWIQENLPSDVKLLVNSAFAYGGTAIVGTDGGWWLPLLAKRQTSQPPLPYLSEVGPSKDYVRWINTLPRQILTLGLNNPIVLDELKQRGIDYLYIGQQQGMVNSTEPLIKLDLLEQNPNFQLIYRQDRVRIYKIVKETN